MADSFSDLRNAGGSNKPWIAAGVSALAVALILIALAGAWRSANPAPEPVAGVPETVTVTARPQEQLLIDAPLQGPYTGTMNAADPAARVKAWPAVAQFGGGTASVTYPLTGCTALVDADGASKPVTKQCSGAVGDGTWTFEIPEPGLVEVTYSENGAAVASGVLSAGA